MRLTSLSNCADIKPQAWVQAMPSASSIRFGVSPSIFAVDAAEVYTRYARLLSVTRDTALHGRISMSPSSVSAYGAKMGFTGFNITSTCEIDGCRDVRGGTGQSAEPVCRPRPEEPLDVVRYLAKSHLHKIEVLFCNVM